MGKLADSNGVKVVTNKWHGYGNFWRAQVNLFYAHSKGK